MASGELTVELEKASYQRFMNIVNQMEKADQGKAVRGALRQGIQVIINAGKSNLTQRNKVHTGNLRKSFAKKVSSKRASAYAGFRRSSTNKRIKGANHSYLVDRGTAKRWTSRGYYRGSVSKGSPNTGSRFWSDAVKTQGPAAMDRIMDAIYQTLDNITRQK